MFSFKHGKEVSRIMQAQAKSKLRQHFLQLRQKQSLSMAAEASARIRKLLLGLELMQKARSILIYLPTKGEVDTYPLLEHFWGQGVHVFLPRCRDHEPGVMDVHRVRTPEELGPGHFGLTEPNPMCTVPEENPKLDIVVVPAIAFDRQGYRLGFGGGYYDRFLSRLMHTSTLIGLAYDFQIVEHLPQEPWDQPLDMIITPGEIIVPDRELGS
ncbi:MAG: 5-formyltetrahydrofolate cyclo-ligase [Desulfovibrionales bacterium]|nr:5-formyltetrahydrofolate cyclo-ligase [Desulfovibrionales bacterium]